MINYDLYPPIEALFDGQVCLCKDPYAYFIPLYNKCQCLFGYIFDPDYKEGVLDKKLKDLYGDYKGYHEKHY